MRRSLALLAGALLVALVSACAQHQPYCERAIQCVETCDGEAFLQCGGCPEGSIPLAACLTDGGPEDGAVADGGP